MSNHGDVLELFAGIGGMACAWPEAREVTAVDINRRAAAIYRQNFRHRYIVAGLDGGSVDKPPLRDAWNHSTWWMSPPCQPFVARGKQRDHLDPRSRPFLVCVQMLEKFQPEWLVLENVTEFAASRCYQLLLDKLQRHGYSIQTIHLCPTDLGWPNRRPRFYLLAGKQPCQRWKPMPRYTVTVLNWIERTGTAGVAPEEISELLVQKEITHAWGEGMDRWHPGSDRPTACFTAAYGKSWLKAGSYVVLGNGEAADLRRFHPVEVARWLGFPPTFQLRGLSNRAAWKLLGNSLSLPVVRYVLSHLPHGPDPVLPWLKTACEGHVAV